MRLFKKRRKENYKKGIDSSVSKNAQVGDDCEIGNYTYIGQRCYVTKAKIGNYVSIANNVAIGQGEHPVSDISTSHIFMDDPYNDMTKGDCIIGNDVWIGVNAVIRRGVKIGDGAVIGANSFVNKDVPDFAIVAGSPAKLIRYRFSEDIIEKIKNSKWWEKEAEDAKKVVAKLRKLLPL